MKNLESVQQRKQNKQMSKWQLNQMAKILSIQTNRLQIVVCHFLANKHSIVLLQGLI